MKKLFIFIITIVVLTGCNSMQKLRVNYMPKSNTQFYYYDKLGNGHNENVKYERTSNTTANITIPAKYVEKQNDTLPKPLPNALKLVDLNTTFKRIGTCDGFISKTSKYDCNYCCQLSDNTLTLGIQSDKNDIYYKYFLFNDPFKELNAIDAGVNVVYKVSPEELFINCDKTSCIVADKNNQAVNEIIISKIISIDKKKINKLILEEKKEQEEEARREKQRKIEEAKREKEELKRIEKELKEAQRKQKLRDKECSALYRTLYRAQQGYYIDPIIGLETAKRFDELGCVFWLNEKMNGY